MRLTLDQEAYDDLRAIQALLGQTSDSKDLATVVGRSLKLLRQQLEKRKFAATDRPRDTGSRPRRTSHNPRHIPERVRRAVWARDQGRCTFVSESGQRCPARTGLELDHIEPVARGGEATEQNLRLRCRAHNQYEAESTFGAGFMHEKREAARTAAARRRGGGLCAEAIGSPRPAGA